MYLEKLIVQMNGRRIFAIFFEEMIIMKIREKKLL